MSLRMFFLAMLACTLLVAGAAAATTEPSLETWARRAQSQIIRGRECSEAMTGLKAELDRSGMPPLNRREDGTGEDQWSAWRKKASKPNLESLKRLALVRKDMAKQILELWVTTSIGGPITERSPRALADEAPAILEEYATVVRKRSGESFDHVFMSELETNLRALHGEYYRQVTLMLCANVAIESGLYSTLFDLDDLSPAVAEQREWLTQVFSEWYYIHLEYGTRWVDHDGKPKLHPLHREQFDLVQKRL